MAEIRAKAGTPVAADFMGPGAPTLCAPVLVDSTTGFIYTLKTGDVVVVAGAAGTGTVASVSQTFTGGIVSVAGSPVTTTGTLALTVAGTSGGIPYFSSGTAWASSAALAASAIVLGGGAGAAPATTTTGTGVVTALGVNVGSAGAFVTFNGALGTPSSGTVTNLSGTFPAGIDVTSKTGTGTTFVMSAGPTISGTLAASAITASSTITPSQTAGIVGTTTNNSVGAGGVGEVISSLVTSGSPVTITNNNAINVTSISLTAGDWDVWGNFSIVTVGTSPAIAIGWVSATSATVPDQSLYSGIQASAATVAIAAGTGFPVPQQRFLLSATIPVYLSVFCSNTVGDSTACGNIFARRRR